MSTIYYAKSKVTIDYTGSIRQNSEINSLMNNVLTNTRNYNIESCS